MPYDQTTGLDQPDINDAFSNQQMANANGGNYTMPMSQYAQIGAPRVQPMNVLGFRALTNPDIAWSPKDYMAGLQNLKEQQPLAQNQKLMIISTYGPAFNKRMDDKIKNEYGGNKYLYNETDAYQDAKAVDPTNMFWQMAGPDILKSLPSYNQNQQMALNQDKFKWMKEQTVLSPDNQQLIANQMAANPGMALEVLKTSVSPKVSANTKAGIIELFNKASGGKEMIDPVTGKMITEPADLETPRNEQKTLARQVIQNQIAFLNQSIYDIETMKELAIKNDSSLSPFLNNTINHFKQYYMADDAMAQYMAQVGITTEVTGKAIAGASNAFGFLEHAKTIIDSGGSRNQFIAQLDMLEQTIKAREAAIGSLVGAKGRAQMDKTKEAVGGPHVPEVPSKSNAVPAPAGSTSGKLNIYDPATGEFK